MSKTLIEQVVCGVDPYVLVRGISEERVTAEQLAQHILQLNKTSPHDPQNIDVVSDGLEELGVHLGKNWASYVKWAEGKAGGKSHITDLPRDQQIVLWATSGFKSSYPPYGKHVRFMEAWNATGIEPEDWVAAKKALISKKLLNAAGALTSSGKDLLHGEGLTQHALSRLKKSGHPTHINYYADQSAMFDRISNMSAVV